MGSGGFSLIGTGVREGGTMWPLALCMAGVLIVCSSFTYAESFKRFHKTTSESDSVHESFGPIIEALGSFSILFYNLASIIVILTLCSHTLLPTSSWATQVSFTIAILAAMATLSLYGIDMNKHLITGLTWFLISILVVASFFGIWGGLTRPIPTLEPSGGFMKSFWKFFFVLVGFDAIMKFSEEAKDDADIPTAFYLANTITILLTACIALAITIWVSSAKQNTDVLAHLFAVFTGAWILQPFRWLVVLCLLVTSFVVFLATTRYMYGLGDQFGDTCKWLQSTNEMKAPWSAIASVFGCGSVLALLNNVDKLVIITDVGFASIASLVASSVAVASWKAANIGATALSGATAASFCGLTLTAFLSI